MLGSANCAAAVTRSAADAAALEFEEHMARAELEHEAAVLSIDNNLAEALCYNAADMELVGAKAAGLRMTQANQAQAASIINLRGQKSYTAGLWAEGNVAIANERRRLEQAMPPRAYLTEEVEDYKRAFRYAQRMTWVAVRSVEYEFQTSLPGDQDATLAATLPADLDEVLRSLASYTLVNAVDGSAPTSRLSVVSLRDHLLQLQEPFDVPGAQGLTTAEQLQVILMDAQFAVYDADGNWLGQQIPFALQPLGALGLGESEGIPLVGQGQCAERLWAVNAAVVTTRPLDADASTVTVMDLLHRNTFTSQACDGGDPISTTVRPAVDLLADFTFDELNAQASTNSLDAFARAQLGPRLDVTRAAFEAADFVQGESTQLASRGLYGEYAQFLPAAALNTTGSGGLDLTLVDDILLRFDYVLAAD